MSARVSAAERAALPVARAALESQGSAYGVSDAIVFALGGAQLLQSPETVANAEHVAKCLVDRTKDLTVAEAELDRVRRAYTFDTAELKRRVAELELERHSTNEELSKAAERVAELEQQLTAAVESPLAWAEDLDAKSLDNLLITLSQAADYEPMNGAISYIHELLTSFRVAAAARGGEPR